jgi:hypothetical protein
MAFQKELVSRPTPEFPCPWDEENVRRRILRDRRKRKGRGGLRKRKYFGAPIKKFI